MSKRLGAQLPDKLMGVLSGEAIDQQLYKALLLITVDEKGWPYVAMLSFLEVVAVDAGNIRMAPWNDSTSSANLRHSSKATLIIVDEEMAFYIQGTASELSRDLPEFPGMAKMNLRVDSVLEDEALEYEGAARISTGIRYENPSMNAEYVARGRRVVAALKS